MTTDQLINKILRKMVNHLDSQQMTILSNVLYEEFQNVKLVESDTELCLSEDTNNYYIEMFLATKVIEGCSKETINQYGFKLKQFCNETGYDLLRVTTNHIRAFLYKMLTQKQWSKATQESSRHVLGSFYRWMADEDYVDKNPCSKLKSIHQDKKVIKLLTQEDVEKMRDACND